MPNGTGNSRNFQISGKRDNFWRLSKIFEMSFQKRSVPFDFVPEFPEILVQWIAPDRALCVPAFQRCRSGLWRLGSRIVVPIWRRPCELFSKPLFSL